MFSGQVCSWWTEIIEQKLQTTSQCSLSEQLNWLTWAPKGHEQRFEALPPPVCLWRETTDVFKATLAWHKCHGGRTMIFGTWRPEWGAMTAMAVIAAMKFLPCLRPMCLIAAWDPPARLFQTILSCFIFFLIFFFYCNALCNLVLKGDI